MLTGVLRSKMDYGVWSELPSGEFKNVSLLQQSAKGTGRWAPRCG